MRLLSKLKTIVKTSTPSTTTSTSILKESEAIETAPIFTLADRLPQLPALPNIPRRASARVRQLLPSVPFVSKKPQLDILIIGAGISGIDMATHIARDKRLSKSLKRGRVAIVEKRDAIGGTWDLFKYPGVRSDSDMTTFGFAHRPWMGKKTLADAASIKNYIEDAAKAGSIDSLIQFNTNVSQIEWSSERKYWTATLVDVNSGNTRTITSRFIIGATGYYDFDQGYQPHFTGQEQFKGQIIHPQQWQDDIVYDNKRVVVIGSGATAVTLVPALLQPNPTTPSQTPQRAAHVTMLQRSPTYIGSVPSEDDSLNTLSKRFNLNTQTAYTLVRWRNILAQQGLYRFAQVAPTLMKKGLISRAKKELKGSDVDIKHFQPSYDPWDERLCAVPDGDLFKVLQTPNAEIVTDTIEYMTDSGIQLTSGRHLEADIIVSATGLKLQMLGGAQVIIDGERVQVNQRMTYKAVLVENAPNLAVLFGYTNASWTLKIDLACDYIVRLLRHMHQNGHKTFVPSSIATDGDTAIKQSDTVMGALSAGYIRRAEDVLPKQGDRYPWHVTNNYLSDIIMLKYQRIEDKWLKFSK